MLSLATSKCPRYEHYQWPLENDLPGAKRDPRIQAWPVLRLILAAD